MDLDEALRLLRGGERGIEEWNRRREEGEKVPGLDEKSDLSRYRLSGVNLSRIDLSGIDLSGADLSGADFSGANLTWVDFTWADLAGADITNALIGKTVFADNDLSQVKGLSSTRHRGPSAIGVDTLIRSQGKIPESFLRGCGVPDALIEYLPSLLGSMSPIQFYSCFISYSTMDEEFAKRLHARLVQEKLRVWFAPEDIQGGKKLHEQIDQAIRVHDKLLLVISEHSMKSEWVATEIRKARTAEVRDGKRRLFPIRLADFEAIRAWECFDADSGKDLGVEIREYFVPDFSNWKDHDAFEAGFARLLRDLKLSSALPNDDVVRG